MSDRTPQEREAARLERERRRALERGEQPPPAPAPVEVPPQADVTPAVAEETPEPAPPIAPVEHLPAPIADVAPGPPAPEPVPAVPEPVSAAPEPLPAAPEPLPAAPEPIAPLPPVAARHEASSAAPARTLPAAAPPRPGQDTDDHDIPIGTVRPGAGAPGMPRQPVSVPRRRRRRPGRMAVLGCGALVLALVAYFAFQTFNPLKGDGSGVVVVRIPPGTGTRQIGNLLARRGVVGSGFFFSLRAKLGGDTLRSGTFTLKHDMSNGAALTALTTVPRAAATIKVLIPEGPGRREVAPIVARQGVTGDYLTASSSSARLNPRTYGAPKGASLEGFLFPATYDLARGASATTLVRKQLDAYKANTAGINYAYARKKNLTRYDVLTIASIIEREAFRDKDRRLVAAVFYNRLKQGISLGSDATTRYAVNNFTRPLKVSQLKSTSPYNTRVHTGLPPGPIGNPGRASIAAAADPARVPYLFFIVKACGRGALAFSSTNAQFQKDVAAYNAARARNGGSDPSVCKK